MRGKEKGCRLRRLTRISRQGSAWERGRRRRKQKGGFDLKELERLVFEPGNEIQRR